MKTIDKTQLKANLLEFLQLVELEGEEILVTDDSKPVTIISQYQYSPTTAELLRNIRLIIITKIFSKTSLPGRTVRI